jgi:hypothetical protein
VRIQAFICNWPGKKQHAAELEAKFRQHCEVMVINTDDSLRARHPHWHHIGKEGYFTDQWNAALEQFDADVFLQIQADIWPTQLGRMLSECVRYISNFGVGVYAPNLNYTAHVFRRESLVRVNDAVYEVPNTDSSFWAMTSEVLRNTPAINPKINRLGWGTDYLVSVVARRKGRKVVRDYRFTAGHLKSRGYSSANAWRQFAGFMESLDPTLRDEINALVKERDRVVVDKLSGTFAAIRGLDSRAARALLIFQSHLESAMRPASEARTDSEKATAGPK